MNHKPSTHDSYRSVLDRHLISAFGDIHLDAITKHAVKEFVNDKIISGVPSNRKGKKLTVNSVRNIKRHLSSILSEAVDDELISENPA